MQLPLILKVSGHFTFESGKSYTWAGQTTSNWTSANWSPGVHRIWCEKQNYWIL